MGNGFESEHWNNEEGNPAGGCSYGTGFTISWQNGPLGRDEERVYPNGAFVEDVVAAVKDRMQFYQDSKFASKLNAQCIAHLEAFLILQEQRTQQREDRGVEGTHSV